MHAGIETTGTGARVRLKGGALQKNRRFWEAQEYL
jgi:hypothetical protein